MLKFTENYKNCKRFCTLVPVNQKQITMKKPLNYILEALTLVSVFTLFYLLILIFG